MPMALVEYRCGTGSSQRKTPLGRVNARIAHARDRMRGLGSSLQAGRNTRCDTVFDMGCEPGDLESRAAGPGAKGVGAAE